ncbi:uncharacterized protein LOC131892220 [Tigriopus californicus]|uniref:uncharacterized protein LOC131892220 n=1 Tax=Tigriopus californicus TaxID=6832 RepID=UPI0027DA9471|nr:uncharacterized protein LOC131892220 [Tigriopus californicus]
MGGKSLVFVLMSASLLIGVQSMAASRLARVFSPLNVVQFPNDPCSSTGGANNGTCYTQGECTSRKGVASGTCAGGFGVCCVFVGGCGTMVRENSTYFQGDATTMAGGCSYQVCPVSNDICQIRLDFIMFNIAGPDVSTTTTFSTLNGNAVEMGGAASNMASNCITDSFSATDGSGMGSNVICGDNTGQHMYLSAEGGCVKLMFQFGSMAMGMGTAMAMRMWKIKVSQISCQSELLAPQGCTQYITNPLGMGMVQTFNFNGGQHLANQNQNICIRREGVNCRLCFSSVAATDFAVSGLSTKTMGSTKGCCGYGATGTGVNGKDCVTIPGAKNAAGLFVSPKFCGRGGLVTVDMMAAASVCTTTIPFSVRFISDDFEFAGAINEATVMDKGFKLSYMQDAVMCV